MVPLSETMLEPVLRMFMFKLNKIKLKDWGIEELKDWGI